MGMDPEMTVFVDALECPTWLSKRARLVELKDEESALELRLDWANRVLEKWRNSRARCVRDAYAAQLLRVRSEIRDLEMEES